MAAVPDQVIQRIKKYVEKLRLNEIPISQAYLFGSYARGTFDNHSDIDIALVSSKFKGNRIDDKDLIRKITIEAGSDVDVIPFKPEDFMMDNPLAKEISSYGVRII